jgi:beta-galactosidase
VAATTREIIPFTGTWRFIREDMPQAAAPDHDDAAWEEVEVPHDWAIAGPFAREHDLQYNRVVVGGERQMVENSGSTGALPHVGVGWYRRRFMAPAGWEQRRVFVEFDGVMSHARVFLDGTEIGYWPYGYSSFSFELTPYIRPGREHVLAVRVDNPPEASRWYPGAGLYRFVRLVVTHPIHVAHWGTYITTPQVTAESAFVHVRTEVRNSTSAEQAITLRTLIIGPDGREAGQDSVSQRGGETLVFNQQIAVPSPACWDPDNPQLYKAISIVIQDGAETDRYETVFGIRTVRFDAETGFYINGRHLKLNGVCMHHDLGALGTAINRSALRRQLTILKDMGCNAIRTSHNSPAPELLQLCDEMGFLVIDEAFDEWEIAKVPNGYHTLFKEWAEKDLRAMLRRDRNHPCIIMWSIGNEIPEQNSAGGADVARFLTAICHEEDPTRPVTAGFNISDEAIANGLAAAVDVPGWNYRPRDYKRYRAEHPEWVMYGSETASCVSSRGEYFFPVRDARNVKHPNLHCSSYDVEAPSWAYPPEYEFQAQDENPGILGEFVWTGFDYLGEPTPYISEWPSRSSYFGIVDLCGFPKDRYYLYRSRWSTAPTLHLLPHWTWPGREGEVTPVHCYTSYPAAELFLNGKSLGVKRKDATQLFGRYRLIWEDVVYEPGELWVVAYDESGAAVAEQKVVTAGPPAAIELSVDRASIAADGEDLAFVTVRIVDAAGNLCPWADDLVSFILTGPGAVVAVDNGDQTSLAPFRARQCRAFHGLCLAIVRGNRGEAGKLQLTATACGLRSGSIVVETIMGTVAALQQE